MRYGGLLVGLILVVGVAGTVVALHSREENTQFVSQQQALTPVGATQLERLVITTSDPRPGYGAPTHPHARARNVHCVAGTRSALGNPWSCVVRYPRPPRVRYRVTVYADRSIFGSGQTEESPAGGDLTIRGCCVAVGVAP
jgi:hypothetical protein